MPRLIAILLIAVVGLPVPTAMMPRGPAASGGCAVIAGPAQSTCCGDHCGCVARPGGCGCAEPVPAPAEPVPARPSRPDGEGTLLVLAPPATATAPTAGGALPAAPGDASTLARPRRAHNASRALLGVWRR